MCPNRSKNPVWWIKVWFINSEYHGSLKLIVASPPITDAEYVIKKKSINDKILFLSIYRTIHYKMQEKKLFGLLVLVAV